MLNLTCLQTQVTFHLLPANQRDCPQGLALWYACHISLSISLFLSLSVDLLILIFLTELGPNEKLKSLKLQRYGVFVDTCPF